ncbi:TonB-linked SusC/RagA family outer membrane protein [Chitinophaga sp. W2I13]|uniref:SusC/RagA family TonB-linked outer membrane protein n=1 Tax=Chitinophaga sp. W2I13 TaxID=3373923 RepID=UPI003D1A63CE
MIKLLLHRPVFKCPVLILIILLISFPNFIFANLMPLQSHKITLVALKIPLKDVFDTITKQTGLLISNNFKETHLSENKTIAVNFRQTNINDVMKFILSDNKALGFKVEEKKIVISLNSLSSTTALNMSKVDTSISRFPISGKVTDNTGNSLPGATIKIKNTTRGTISNEDGTFQLPNVNNGDVIIISSIGYESSELEVKGKKIIAPLKSHANKLDERVVIAYGSTTRRLNTGNIGSIKAVDIEKQPVNNPILAVQGRVAGVFIEQASGLSGTGVKINIQGTNSLRNGNDPFYVIDGVPYISQLIQPSISGITAGSTGLTGNPLNFINPAIIESIEILKDADATAIYGSRAANGAVLITTKKGKIGSMKVDLNAQSGWGKVAHKLNVLNAQDYLAMRHEALKNNNITSPSQYDYDLNGQWDTTQIKDWQKELIGGPANYSDIQLSVSGGSQLTQYLISGGYHKETTVFPGDYSDVKGSLHFFIKNSSVNQKFSIQLSGSYMKDNNRLPQTDLTANAIKLSPIAPSPLNTDGSLNWSPTPDGATTYYNNPLVFSRVEYSNKTSNLTSQAMLSYDIYSGLTFKTNFGFNNLYSDELTPRPLSLIFPENRPYTLRQTTFSASKMESWVIEPQLTFDKSIFNGKLNALLGATLQNNYNSRQEISASGFNNDLLMKDLKSATTLQVNQSVNETYKYSAVYGRLNYNWMDKYIVNLTIRRDGSSRFGPRNQFHNFGAIGAAWIFSQDLFIQKLLPFLSFGKLRGSYGTTGSDQIPDYQFLDLYQTNAAQVPYQGVLGLAPNRLFTPDLQWEETKKLQAGIELGFIKNKILFTLNYNRNRSSNQLIGVPIPYITGAPDITKNFNAVVQNKGWEFTFNSTNIKTKKFSWNTFINLTIPQNKLISYESTTNTLFKVGQSITSIPVYELAGVNDSTGAFQFKDGKGNLVGLPSATSSYVNIDPKFYGGIQNSFVYKGFSLDFLFQFVKKTGKDLSLGYSSGSAGAFSNGAANQPITVLSRWQKVGDQTTQPKFNNTSSAILPLLYARSSDAAYSDASYIRLKNISISWQLPQTIIQKTQIQNARIYILGQNIFTLTNYFGLNPESQGLGLPPLRVITFGAQITF